MIGKIIIINGNEFRQGDNISYSADLDSMSNELSFDWPYTPTFLSYGKFTPIEIYAGEVSTSSYKKEDLIKIWDGYLIDSNITRGKTSSMLSVTVSDKVNWFNFNEPLYAATSDYLLDYINVLKQAYASSDLTIPFVITPQISEENVLCKPNNVKNSIEQFSSIKEKTVIYFDYVPWDNVLYIKTPQFIQALAGTVKEVPVFDASNILSELKINSTTSQVTSVVYVGQGGRKGVAIDFLSYAQGKKQREVRYFATYTSNMQELEKLARNKLLEMTRNNIVEFDIALTNISLKYRPGDIVILKDGELFNGESFIIKTITFTLAKTDIKCSLKCYSSMLSTLPSDFITKDFNITDIDTFKLNPDKVTTAYSVAYGYNGE